jgi:hypothetical protein
MKRNALSDLLCPFNYRAELEKARYLLNKKVREYALRNRTLGYWALAVRFNVSTGTLFAIATKKRNWKPVMRRARIHDNGFDDLQCPFNYREELKKVREALNKKLRVCASKHSRHNYRRLAERFKISVGTLFAIARGHKKKLKPGRWPSIY